MTQNSTATYSQADIFVYAANQWSLGSTPALVFMMHEKQELPLQDLVKHGKYS